ncbi:MAG: hypothetical protein KUG72_12640 [Pseudomonadales bacterium]|nr:hypothetical protein [Pseudomonadales bacterium]
MTNIIHGKQFKLKKEILEIQLDLLWKFTRSLAYYRAIQQEQKRIERNKVFWTHTMNAHYLRAIIDWCIVFGADQNEAHWKKLSTNEIDELKLEVRPLILKAGSFTESEFKAYHSEITDFRNGYASHRNVGFNSNVPSLDKAYEIAKEYFEWLKILLRPAKNEPKPLANFFPEAQIEILHVLKSDFEKI